MSPLTAPQLEAFLEKHRLPREFRRVVGEHYESLARWVYQLHKPHTAEIIGISGAQGTGKSTLSEFLRLSLETQTLGSVAILSLDDFYLTRAQRQTLGQEVHPLLATRGAPGTHDLELCVRCLTRLKELGSGERLALPRFDKAQDDRLPETQWPSVTGPLDLIIFEGWCLGSQPQSPESLKAPINRLEKTQDPDASWRLHVNRHLEGGYAKLFARLDRLIFLKAPDFESVHRWRLEQEQKLSTTATDASFGIMTDAQIAEFVQHYERLTRANIAQLPRIADVTLELDRTHQIAASHYRQ